MFKKFDSDSRFSKKKDFAKPLFDAHCSECGVRCEVPFKPVGKRPVFCRDCFRKQEDGGQRDFRPSFDDKRLFPAVCATCQDRCEVPFKPTSGRPVYCRSCMASQNGASDFVKPLAAGGKMTDEQFKTLNSKLDKILKVLELAMEDFEEGDEFDEEEEEEEEVEEVKEVMPAKKKPTRGQIKRAKRTGKA